MAGNPCVVGWRADEHHADENFGDPALQLVAAGDLPPNSVSLVWGDRAVTPAPPSWPNPTNSARLTKEISEPAFVPFKTITLVDDEHGSAVRQS
jgi:hypothetical protein